MKYVLITGTQGFTQARANMWLELCTADSQTPMIHNNLTSTKTAAQASTEESFQRSLDIA